MLIGKCDVIVADMLAGHKGKVTNDREEVAAGRRGEDSTTQIAETEVKFNSAKGLPFASSV